MFYLVVVNCICIFQIYTRLSTRPWISINRFYSLVNVNGIFLIFREKSNKTKNAMSRLKPSRLLSIPYAIWFRRSSNHLSHQDCWCISWLIQNINLFLSWYGLFWAFVSLLNVKNAIETTRSINLKYSCSTYAFII